MHTEPNSPRGTQADRAFEPGKTYRASQIASAPSHCHDFPDWAGDAFREFSRVMRDPAFPCTFARAAFGKDSLLFAFPGGCDDSLTVGHIHSVIKSYLAELNAMADPVQTAMTVLNVFLRPEGGDADVSAYTRKFWQLLQNLHDADEVPWPESVPTDPDDPAWSYCLQGVPLFFNMNCPAYVLRRSRNLGSCMTLVLNPRDAFDIVAGANDKGDKVRAYIRSLISKYDGQAPAPQLGSYGRATNREWQQYALPDENIEITGLCPLRIRRKPNS